MSNSGSGTTAPAGPNWRGFLSHPLAVALIAVLAGSAVDAAAPVIPYPWRQQPASAPRTIDITSPIRDAEVNGRPEIRGKVRNLRQGDVVWSYNQPRRTKEAYPDYGPCRVEGEDFSCRLTALSVTEEDIPRGARDFTLWVAVISSEDAVKNSEAKARYEGTQPFMLITDSGPPRLDNAVASVDVSCVVDVGCPVSSEVGVPIDGSAVADARIVSPKDGAKVKGSDLRLAGTGPEGSRLLLFDHDPEPGAGYVLDTETALTPSGGQWEFVDSELDPGRLDVILVLASAECEAWVKALKPDADGTFFVPKIDAACAQVDTLSVTMT